MRYLFVSYIFKYKDQFYIGDSCFSFDKDHQWTIKEIRDSILKDYGFENAVGCSPAITNLQVLDEDVAKMLYPE